MDGAAIKYCILGDSMIDELFKNKPNSIHDVIPSTFFTKYDSYDYIWSGTCYEWYWAVAKTIKPKTFMEIGVKLGFSFLSTLAATDTIEYALGWDLQTYGSDHNEISRANITEYYKGTSRWEILHMDSQAQSELPQFFDLVSIDGCHDYNCKIHDLNIAAKNCRYIILDDYDYLPNVRNSVSQWMRDNVKIIDWALYIPTFRGSQLIKIKEQ